ncbi:MAG: MFS transporter [Candidatus Eremiobacteraeota bacterium]|nr:MFS transporter [Candidatus Eremiobacteraeota bacterium]
MDTTAPAQPFGIFSSRGFRLFYAGQALSYIGDGLRSLALPLLVFKLTGSALTLGVTYALQFLPFAVAGLIGGSLADRLDRRRLLIACDFVRFIVLALFVVAGLRGFLSLPLIYAGIVVISVSAAVFLGGQSSSIPFLLGRQASAPANGALIAAEQGANLIAPPLGGALFTLYGAVPALAVNAFTYLTSLIAIARIPSLGPERPSKVTSVREVAADIAQGFSFLTADAAMRTITWLSLFLNLFGMMAMAVYIPFYKIALGANDAQVGLTLGVNALGAGVGSLLAGKYANHWPFGAALCIAYIIDGLIFVPVMFAHHIWVATLFFSLASGGAAFETTQIISWRMRVVPLEKIGRVFGAVRLIALFGVVPGTLIGGYLADHYGVRTPITVSTLGYLFIALSAVAVRAVRTDRR